MPTDPYSWLEDSLAIIHRANWYRSGQSIQSRPGPTVLLQGREVLNFASNDYLGLAGDDRLIQAAIAATQAFGTGSTGSRLLSGQRSLHLQLEQAIADLKQTEAALVFSSGYLANLGTIAALVNQRDLILADQYNHSSLKSGAILSGATVVNYSHCNVEDLRAKLNHQRGHYRRCLILTDSVFSMDGDLCPLPDLLAITQQFSCMLLVDEAHATGLFGKSGAGCVEHFGCTGSPLIQVGTLSKALGSLGGYVAGSSSLIDFLRNRAPGWIYTTGLSPADTAAALAAIAIVQREPERRVQLWQRVHHLKQLMLEEIPNLNTPQSSFRLLPSESPILCIQMKNTQSLLVAEQQLKQAGLFVPAIRPPTVPVSRLRMTLMATHELSHIQQLAKAIKTVKLIC